MIGVYCKTSKKEKVRKILVLKEKVKNNLIPITRGVSVYKYLVIRYFVLAP